MLSVYLSAGASVVVGDGHVSDERPSGQVLIDLSVASLRQRVDAYHRRVVVDVFNEHRHLNTATPSRIDQQRNRRQKTSLPPPGESP